MSSKPTAQRSYFVIDYQPGSPAPTSAATPEDHAVSALKRHLEHLRDGHQAGMVVMAGPWTGELASGFVIFNGTQSQVDQFIESDPAVRQAVLAPTVRTWSPLVGVPPAS